MVINRLLAIRAEIEEVLRDLKVDSLSNSEWDRLGDLQKLLAPFKEQTDHLQTDTLSMSAVIPSLVELSLHLQDPTLPAIYSTKLLQSLRSRFACFLDPTDAQFSALPAAACYLDPTVSTVMIRDDMQPLVLAAKNYIKAHVSGVFVLFIWIF